MIATLLLIVLGVQIDFDTSRLIDWICGGAVVSSPGVVQFLRTQARRIGEALDKVESLEAKINALEKRIAELEKR